MKKLLSIFIATSLILSLLSGCKEAQTKITAKEGSSAGIVIIGDYTIKTIGTPCYETGSVNQFGHYSHIFTSEIEIENNSNDAITFDKLSEMGLTIYGYDGGSCCGEMTPRWSGDSSIDIASGDKSEFELSCGNPSYGASPAGSNDHYYSDDSGEYYKIEICYNGDVISSIRYD